MAQPEWCWRLSRDANAGPGRDAGHRPSRETPRASPAGLLAPAQTGKEESWPSRGRIAPAQPGFSHASPAGTEDRPDLPRTGPGGTCCCAGALAQPGPKMPRADREREDSAQDELVSAQKGQNRYMPAWRRIIRPENIYADRGNVGVDPGPTYVSRDINMSAGA
jgi:hypothetical protein